MLVKLEWLGYRMVIKLWRHVKPFSSDTATLRTDRFVISISRISILRCWRAIIIVFRHILFIKYSLGFDERRLSYRLRYTCYITQTLLRTGTRSACRLYSAPLMLHANHTRLHFFRDRSSSSWARTAECRDAPAVEIMHNGRTNTTWRHRPRLQLGYRLQSLGHKMSNMLQRC